MSAANKEVVAKINKAFEAGDVEAFLAFCPDDFEWTMVGQTPLRGKEAIRAFMGSVPSNVPVFTVDALVAEGDIVTCVGDMTMKEDGRVVPYSYCDVWRFRGGTPVTLKAFVIKTDQA